jgi:hypothetical protein
MATSKTDKIIIKAVMIILALILVFSAFFYLRPQPFEIKDGALIVPDAEKAFPESKPKSTVTIPEDLTFKGTFSWEEKDGHRPEDNGTCYLRIYTYEGETMAQFSYGEHLIDGWPVFLVSRSGNTYILESSTNSFVERVRIVVDATANGMSGTVKNITPEISNFVRGDFKGEAITYEQYVVDVID